MFVAGPTSGRASVLEACARPSLDLARRHNWKKAARRRAGPFAGRFTLCVLATPRRRRAGVHEMVLVSAAVADAPLKTLLTCGEGRGRGSALFSRVQLWLESSTPACAGGSRGGDFALS